LTFRGRTIADTTLAGRGLGVAEGAVVALGCGVGVMVLVGTGVATITGMVGVACDAGVDVGVRVTTAVAGKDSPAVPPQPARESRAIASPDGKVRDIWDFLPKNERFTLAALAWRYRKSMATPARRAQ
jgi:hypothetical protein